jgi:TPR repeat protein
MSDSRLQPTPRASKSPLSLSKTRTDLITRGCRDAALLADAALPEPSDYLAQLRRRAEAGDSEAQYQLGEMYAGECKEHLNYSQAVYWLHRAALGGVEDAIRILEWLAPGILLDSDLLLEHALALHLNPWAT